MGDAKDIPPQQVPDVPGAGKPDVEMARVRRDQLRDALRHGGYGELATKREARDWTESAIGFAIILGGPVGWATLLVGHGLRWPFAVAGALVAVVLIALAVGAEWFGATVVVFVVVALTFAAPTVMAMSGHLWELAVTLGFACVIMLVIFVLHRFDAASVVRTVRAIKSVLTDVPLLFPLVTLVIFALILSNEIWQIAGDEDPVRLTLLAVVVIAPVAWFLRRRLVRSIDTTFVETARKLAAETDLFALVVSHIGSVSVGKRAPRWTDQRADVQRSFKEENLEDFAQRRCELIRGRFKRRISIRLMLTVTAVGVVAFVIIYALAVMLISETVARCWSFVPDDATGAGASTGACGSPADGVIQHVSVAGQSLPLGPYLRVAVLLAILACAIFIAFVITTNDVSTQFHAAYIEEPAMTALLLAVPYVAAERILGTPDVPGEPANGHEGEPVGDDPLGDLEPQPA